MIRFEMTDRTIADVPETERERLRATIRDAIRQARDQELAFLAYLLEMAGAEAHRDLRE